MNTISEEKHSIVEDDLVENVKTIRPGHFEDIKDLPASIRDYYINDWNQQQKREKKKLRKIMRRRNNTLHSFHHGWFFMMNRYLLQNMFDGGLLKRDKLPPLAVVSFLAFTSFMNRDCEVSMSSSELGKMIGCSRQQSLKMIKTLQDQQMIVPVVSAKGTIIPNRWMVNPVRSWYCRYNSQDLRKRFESYLCYMGCSPLYNKIQSFKKPDIQASDGNNSCQDYLIQYLHQMKETVRTKVKELVKIKRENSSMFDYESGWVDATLMLLKNIKAILRED